MNTVEIKYRKILVNEKKMNKQIIMTPLTFFDFAFSRF